jgi:hypothetical protein
LETAIQVLVARTPGVPNVHRHSLEQKPVLGPGVASSVAVRVQAFLAGITPRESGVARGNSGSSMRETPIPRRGTPTPILNVGTVGLAASEYSRRFCEYV